MKPKKKKTDALDRLVYEKSEMWAIVGTPKHSESERIVWKEFNYERYWWETYQGSPMIFNSHQKAYAELKKVKMRTCKKPRIVKITLLWR